MNLAMASVIGEDIDIAPSSHGLSKLGKALPDIVAEGSSNFQN